MYINGNRGVGCRAGGWNTSAEKKGKERRAKDPLCIKRRTSGGPTVRRMMDQLVSSPLTDESVDTCTLFLPPSSLSIYLSFDYLIRARRRSRIPYIDRPVGELCKRHVLGTGFWDRKMGDVGTWEKKRTAEWSREEVWGKKRVGRESGVLNWFTTAGWHCRLPSRSLALLSTSENFASYFFFPSENVRRPSSKATVQPKSTTTSLSFDIQMRHEPDGSVNE